MIRSGTSLIHAVEAYKNAGANHIYVVTVHGVFVPGTLERLKSCGCINKILCTNTHVHAHQMNDSFIQVYDISQIISEKLKLLEK